MKTFLHTLIRGSVSGMAALLCLAAISSPAQTNRAPDGTIVYDDKKQMDPAEKAAHDQKMAWFRQAKFGLFIHWGLYALPAGEWDGKRVPGLGEWIMHNAPIPVTDYEKLAKKFNPRKVKAEDWVQMAEDAGMKYIVITSKHHDGFAMYHSQVSKYNIYDATPFHRDPIAELAKGCAKHKMPFGFYYSQAQDWHEPGGIGNTNDFGADEIKDKNGMYDQYLQNKAEPQVAELL